MLEWLITPNCGGVNKVETTVSPSTCFIPYLRCQQGDRWAAKVTPGERCILSDAT